MVRGRVDLIPPSVAPSHTQLSGSSASTGRHSTGLTPLRENVRMSRVRCGLDLGQEALGTNDRGRFGLEDLECDLTLVLEVVGQLHGRHSALAELTLDRVAALQGGVQAGDSIRRGGKPTGPRSVRRTRFGIARARAASPDRPCRPESRCRLGSRPQRFRCGPDRSQFPSCREKS